MSLNSEQAASLPSVDLLVEQGASICQGLLMRIRMCSNMVLKEVLMISRKIHFVAQKIYLENQWNMLQAYRNIVGPKYPKMELHLSQDHAVLDIDQAILGAVDDQNL